MRPAIINRLTEFTGASKAAARDEMMPLLAAMIKDSPNIGDSTEFSLSIRLGFSGEEHASMAGLPLSRRSTKDLIEAYNEELAAYMAAQETLQSAPVEVNDEPVVEPQKNDEEPSPSGQMKLF